MEGRFTKQPAPLLDVGSRYRLNGLSRQPSLALGALGQPQQSPVHLIQAQTRGQTSRVHGSNMLIEALTPLDERRMSLRCVWHRRIPYEGQALLKLLRDHPSRCLSSMTIEAQMRQLEIGEPVFHDVEGRAFFRDKEDSLSA